MDCSHGNGSYTLKNERGKLVEQCSWVFILMYDTKESGNFFFAFPTIHSFSNKSHLLFQKDVKIKKSFNFILVIIMESINITM